VTNIGQASQLLPAYEANEIDFVWGSGTLLARRPGDHRQADPELDAQYFPHYGDFRTYYFFFDDRQPPFDNPQVRQAFAHVLDRDAITANIFKRQGIPAYSFLMPGFPAANSEAFKETYPLDVEKAKQLLADAGYPNGEGFPKLTLKLRAEGPAPDWRWRRPMPPRSRRVWASRSKSPTWTSNLTWMRSTPSRPASSLA
jgi:ABC-type transport system substrate-binding protein